jgi:ATP-binding cassette subfamily B multidrug efflux pump
MADQKHNNPSGPTPAPNPFGMRGPMSMRQNTGTGKTVRVKNMKETLLRLWSYLSRRKGMLTVVFFLTAFSSSMMLIGPYMIGVAIDRYIIPGDYQGLLWLCMFLLGAYIIGSIAAWFQQFIMAKVAQRTVWEMRNDVFDKLQHLPLQFFDAKTHGELMSRTTNDMDQVSITLNQVVAQIIASVITLVGALIMMLILSPWLTLVSLITIPLVLFVTAKIARFTRKYFSGQQQRLGELNGFIEETISGQKVVSSLCREKKSSSEFQSMNLKLEQVGIKAQIFAGLMGPVMNFINNISFALIALAGGWMILSGLTSIGVVVAFLNYSRQFGRPINELANQFNMIQQAIAGAERVFEIMDTETEYDEASSKELKNVKGEVVFKDVCFSYKKDVPVLKNVNFKANPGDTIALVGPTGAGKTTIVNLLTRFYDIDQGKITIDGEDIQAFDKNSLRQQLGIVLQDAYLFADTIRENLRYGNLDATDEEIIEVAKMANADGFISRLPSGYDTLLTGEGGNLSQGQRQLITIARAILANPSILILDEATSSVDTRTEMHIQEAMYKLMKGRTSFVIAHRLSTILKADQILVINDGEVIEMGTHQQLLTEKGFYYELYSSQLSNAG